MRQYCLGDISLSLKIISLVKAIAQTVCELIHSVKSFPFDDDMMLLSFDFATLPTRSVLLNQFYSFSLSILCLTEKYY